MQASIFFHTVTTPLKEYVIQPKHLDINLPWMTALSSASEWRSALFDVVELLYLFRPDMIRA